tara:strand:+ start:114 stop:278 length:165 start_codon:yes stop_codon:yes gene_type:complete
MEALDVIANNLSFCIESSSWHRMSKEEREQCIPIREYNKRQKETNKKTNSKEAN